MYSKRSFEISSDTSLVNLVGASANGVAFLAGDDSKFMTSEILHVNDGLVLPSGVKSENA